MHNENSTSRYLLQTSISGVWSPYACGGVDECLANFAVRTKHYPGVASRVLDTLTGVVVFANAAAMELERANVAAKAAAGPGVQETKPFHIVMSLDKPGPRERNGGEYHRHASRDDAVREARRLSAACKGGRFAVLSASFVTGWVEHDLQAAASDEGIPF